MSNDPRDILDRPNASAPAGSEMFACVQGGQVKKMTGSQIRTGLGAPKHALVNGAAAGDVTVTGISQTDRLDSVIYYAVTGGNVTDVLDLTSEFTITADNKINNTSGTASTGGKLLVGWTDL